MGIGLETEASIVGDGVGVDVGDVVFAVQPATHSEATITNTRIITTFFIITP